MRQLVGALLCIGACFSGASLDAQNVSNYEMLPDPILFLLREPAVHDDLDLSDIQRANLVQLNRSVDGDLLASRNQSPKTAGQLVAVAKQKTLEGLRELLDEQQLRRIQQITYRVQGISFVTTPDATQQLQLTTAQLQQIESYVNLSADEVTKLQRRVKNGEVTPSDGQRLVTDVRTREQRQILAAINDDQQRKFLELIGQNFDVGKLGRVSFQAPDLSTRAIWINSPPLSLSDLKGKVVALHFWAFG